MTYDAVIVGARCAGAPLAMLLAQSEHRVLMVDRATFPSDTMSTHFIQSPGMARLARWGLMDDVFATNCPPIRLARFDVGGDEMEFEIPVHEPIPGLAAPRRYALDKVLVDAAVGKGAELAEGITVESLIRDGDRVVGIAGRGRDGPFEARGRVVIGADGRHSVVASETEAPFSTFVEPVSAGYYSYFRGTGVDSTTLIFREGVVCVMFPTNDDATTVAIAWPRARFSEIRRDIEGNFKAALGSFGPVGEHVRDCERVERFIGAADLSNYVRKAIGPGWMLVGDACYHKDPVPADGITDAFRGAEFAAEAVDAIVTGKAPEEEALAAYEARNKEFADKHLEPAIRAARFDLTAQERSGAFFESRIHNEEEVEQYLAATAG